jgi:hypothetical protein
MQVSLPRQNLGGREKKMLTLGADEFFESCRFATDQSIQL